MGDGVDEPAAGATLDGVSRFLGFRYDGPGVVRLDLREELLNPGGMLSGAVTYALVDYAMGSAVWDTLAADEGIATLSISINYLQTAREGEVTGRAQVDRRNRTAATLRATVEAHDGRLLATAIGSYSIFPRSRYARAGA
jgi:uncharacterized protein (TIGR00369 family)